MTTWEELEAVRDSSKLERPNPEQTWEQFHDRARYDRIVYGTCFIWTIKDAFGATKELWVLHPPHLWPCPADEDHPLGFYRFIRDGKETRISADAVLRTRDPSPVERTDAMSSVEV